MAHPYQFSCHAFSNETFRSTYLPLYSSTMMLSTRTSSASFLLKLSAIIMIPRCQPQNLNAGNLSVSLAHTHPQIVNCRREGNYGSSQQSVVFGPVLLARPGLYGVLSNLRTGAQCGLSSMSSGLALTHTHTHKIIGTHYYLMHNL